LEKVEEDELLDELEVLEADEEILWFLLEAGEFVQLLEADETEGLLTSVSESLVLSRLKMSTVVDRLSIRF